MITVRSKRDNKPSDHKTALNYVQKVHKPKLERVWVSLLSFARKIHGKKHFHD